MTKKRYAGRLIGIIIGKKKSAIDLRFNSVMEHADGKQRMVLHFEDGSTLTMPWEEEGTR